MRFLFDTRYFYEICLSNSFVWMIFWQIKVLKNNRYIISSFKFYEHIKNLFLSRCDKNNGLYTIKCIRFILLLWLLYVFNVNIIHTLTMYLFKKKKRKKKKVYFIINFYGVYNVVALVYIQSRDWPSEEVCYEIYLTSRPTNYIILFMCAPLTELLR